MKNVKKLILILALCSAITAQAMTPARNTLTRTARLGSQALSSATRMPASALGQPGARALSTAGETIEAAGSTATGTIRGALAGVGLGGAAGAAGAGYYYHGKQQTVNYQEIYMPAYTKGLEVQQQLEKELADPKTSAHAKLEVQKKLVMSYLFGETYEAKPLPCRANYTRAREILDSIPKSASWSATMWGHEITAVDILRRLDEIKHETEAQVEQRVRTTFTHQEGDLLRQKRLTRFQ